MGGPGHEPGAGWDRLFGGYAEDAALCGRRISRVLPPSGRFILATCVSALDLLNRESVQGTEILLQGREKASIDIPIESLVECAALRNGFEAAGIEACHGSRRG